MKAFLMHRDQDFDLVAELPPNTDALTQDLELTTILDAMAGGDRLVFDLAKRALLLSLTDTDAIVYRQRVLTDCLAQPAVVREIYDVATDAIMGERKVYYGLFSKSPDTILNRSLEVMQSFVESLKQLRRIGDEHATDFTSEGFTRFFAMLAAELDDDYFHTVDEHLKELRFRRGTLISAELGKGNKGTHYVLRERREPNWRERLSIADRSSYSFTIPDRDDSGFRALSELQGRGLNSVADALAQSVDHVLDFLTMVRAELAFYIGCLNLHERLAAKNEPTCFPVPLPRDGPALSATGLYDVCLSLSVQPRVVGNDVRADGRSLVMVTGANQGGKSTFLRSVGVAQLMMQCGMFVPATSLRASACRGVFTHYKREEDATMDSGKLDEELARMSQIADTITPHCMLLCNESFASTNEREGSQIARQIVRALVEAKVRVFFVTHLFDLAHHFHREQAGGALFLRAERRHDGQRTFRLIEGEPLPTSHGEDLYRHIFGEAVNTAPA